MPGTRVSKYPECSFGDPWAPWGCQGNPQHHTADSAPEPQNLSSDHRRIWLRISGRNIDPLGSAWEAPTRRRGRTMENKLSGLEDICRSHQMFFDHIKCFDHIKWHFQGQRPSSPEKCMLGMWVPWISSLSGTAWATMLQWADP